jgi:hypothetical protein
MANKRRRWITVLSPFVSVFFFIVVGEIALRGYQYVRFDISFLTGQPLHSDQPQTLSPISLDQELGWRATENYRFEGIRENWGGTTYPATITQDEHGFRMYGDSASSKTKILVIGDSFTQAVDASDGHPYYAVVGNRLNAEIFAYGGGGYGSLQELMILDKYVEAIKPDLILWQYSTNDIVNNSVEMETASTINNNGMRRPYLVDGKISYLIPKKDSYGIRLLALQYCRLCYMVMNRVDRLQVWMKGISIESDTAPGQAGHSLFVQAVSTTDKIMKRVAERAGSTPIVAFVVGSGSPYGPEYDTAFMKISQDHRILLLTDVDSKVNSAEVQGTVVRGADGAHWNNTGHEIAGQVIADNLEVMQLRK